MRAKRTAMQQQQQQVSHQAWSGDTAQMSWVTAVPCNYLINIIYARDAAVVLVTVGLPVYDIAGRQQAGTHLDSSAVP